MATMITAECINCGACEAECPNAAIYPGGVGWRGLDGSIQAPLSEERFYIAPERCTECVGFHDHEACGTVCPVDCCVPDPAAVETEAALIARVRRLHPDMTFGPELPSRFRGQAAGGEAAPPRRDTRAGQGSQRPPAAAGGPAGEAPGTRVAQPPEAAATRPAGEGGAEGGEPPGGGGGTRPAGELDLSFEELHAQLGPARRHGGGGWLLVTFLLAYPLPVLGALPAWAKRMIERRLGDRRYFDARRATIANVLANALFYPALAIAAARAASGAARTWAYAGLAAAALEGIVRLRAVLARLGQGDVAVPRGALYGSAFLPLAHLLVRHAGLRVEEGGVAFDGFHGGAGFDEKLERERRYGKVYHLAEREDAYLLSVEFPRRLPPSSMARDLGLGEEMPEYEYELSLEDGQFTVHAKVVDPRARKLTAVAPAFPPEFTTRVGIERRVRGFKHRYRNRVLEVILPKAEARS